MTAVRWTVALLVLAALVPAHANAARDRTIVLAQMKPLSGFSEEGILVLTNWGKTPILSFAMNSGSAITYVLRTSSNSCREIDQTPQQPGFVGRLLIKFDGTTSDGVETRPFPRQPTRRQRRQGRTLVLTGPQGTPRTCGRMQLYNRAP